MVGLIRSNRRWGKRGIAIMVSCFLAAGAASAMAQSRSAEAPPPPPPDPHRFALERVEGGVVRLDRQTGRMSFCALRSGNLVCKLAVEERAAYEKEISRLHDRLEPEPKPGVDVPGSTGPDGTEQGGKGPAGDEERRFDEAMRYAERALRRFFDVIQDLRDEMGQPQEL